MVDFSHLSRKGSFGGDEFMLWVRSVGDSIVARGFVEASLATGAPPLVAIRTASNLN